MITWAICWLYVQLRPEGAGVPILLLFAMMADVAIAYAIGLSINARK